MFKIAYDAGHYLYTSGKRLPKELDKNETREWVLNDRVADYFAEAAKQYEGVELLRTDDPTGKTAIELDERADKANAWGADFYLSIHHNAAGKVFSGGGIVAYVLRKGLKAETYQKAIYKECIKDGGLKGNRSEPLATANFQILRETKAPAVLMEYGFMDSKVDAPVILTKEYSKLVAYATMDAIAQVAGLKRKGTNQMGKYFTDVDDSAWYAEAVNYCKEHGLMSGVSDTKFAPNEPVTRAQLASVLYRLDKQNK